MALAEHIDILKSGRDSWNKWINTNWRDMDGPIVPVKAGIGKLVPHTRADLRGIDFKEFGDLSDYDFYRVDFRGSKLNNVDFSKNRFRWADLSNCNFQNATFENCEMNACRFLHSNFNSSKFSRCTLNYSYFSAASTFNSEFYKCDLSDSFLNWSRFIQTKFIDTKFSFSRIYGISIWDCLFENVEQKELIISKPEEPEISIDNLEIGQFIYLMMSNKKIRDILDTLSSKVVLILGRFTNERIKILREIREALRKKSLVPVLFDFEKPDSRDLTETITTLANLSKFVIADLTDAKSIPQELSHIIPHLPSVPVQPILMTKQREYAMFEHWKRYPWVKDIMNYEDSITEDFISRIIENAKST